MTNTKEKASIALVSIVTVQDFDQWAQMILAGLKKALLDEIQSSGEASLQ